MMTGHKSVVLFYRYFVPSWCPDVFAASAEWYVDRLEEFQRHLCHKLGCKGRILISVEGINGTLSGLNESVIQEYISTMESFHLQRDCGLPSNLKHKHPPSTMSMEDERNFLFRDVDWKKSSVEDGTLEPFPDLKIFIVNEIVSTGGYVKVDEIPDGTGKHLSPKEFHLALGSSEKPLVVIDVRNTFEHEIGHFVLPKTGEAAMNPEMVTFSSFDSNFCARYADELKDKKVLMYCTGGIRCEKASVMLRKRGVEDVSQLSGGIHRYLETFGNDGYFKGLNFVFDQRVAIKPDPAKQQNEVVGRCTHCRAPFDEICGSRVCTVCRDLVLVCPTCQWKLREYHCRRHSSWKDCYFTFLEIFDADELKEQLCKLNEVLSLLIPASAHRNQRRTISRQREKVNEQILKVEAGMFTINRNAPRRCRTCMEPSSLCNGRCWGFWKTTKNEGRTHKKAEESSDKEILPVTVGDIVEPGDHWNTMRFGERTDKDGKLRCGRVIEIKGWSSQNARDCVSVLWDDGIARGRNQAKVQPQIYRWGVLALDGTRMYDVRRSSIILN